MLVGERLHELAQHFRCIPVFSQTGPLERLAEFPFNTDTEANVFARQPEPAVPWHLRQSRVEQGRKLRAMYRLLGYSRTDCAK